MSEEKKETVLSDTEKNMKIAAWLTLFYLIFVGVLVALINYADGAGTWYLYTIAGLAILTVLVITIYIVEFLTRLRKVKSQLVAYILIGIVMLAVGTFIGLYGLPYIADIFGGSIAVMTDEFNILGNDPQNLLFDDKVGEKIGLRITDEMAKELGSNPAIDDGKWSETYLYYHEKAITIEYYPHSEVIKSVVVHN